MNHKILSKVQEQQEEKIDLIKSIKDLEMELEFMYSVSTAKPDEIKYISSAEKQIDELYEKLDKISDENN